MKSKQQIEKEVTETFDSLDSGSKWPGMSYEDGVRAALDWVLGTVKDAPMED